ncbi:hypothetical protein [Sorangium sp. So ce1078]
MICPGTSAARDVGRGGEMQSFEPAFFAIAFTASIPGVVLSRWVPRG